MGTMHLANLTSSKMSREYAEYDIITKMEVCIMELVADEGNMTHTRAKELLQHLSASPERLVFSLNLLKEKLAVGKAKNWSLCLKVLLLQHHLLAENDGWLESMPHSKEHLFSILQDIHDGTGDTFLRNYVTYLMSMICNPMPFKSDASDFTEMLPSLQARICLLTRCKLDATSKAYSSGLASFAIDSLVRDGYRLYIYLRKGMDRLLDNIGRPQYRLWHLEALNVGEDLLSFLSFAYTMVESRLVSYHVVKQQQVIQSTNFDGIEDQQVIQSTNFDNIENQLKIVTSEIQKMAAEIRDIKVTQHAKRAIQGEESSQTYEEVNKLRRLIKHDIKSVVNANASKTNSKVDRLDRHMGAIHEKLSRVLLGWNVDQLVCEGFSDLRGFASFKARLSKRFDCLVQICSYLHLQADEEALIRSTLLHAIVLEDVGKCVLISFLRILDCEIKKRFPQVKWQPRFLKRIVEECEFLSKKLSLAEPFQLSEVLIRLKTIQEMVQSNVKEVNDNLRLLGDHVNDVIQLLHASKENSRDDIMEAPWGLLVLFWVLKQSFRHPLLEVDVCGSAVRDGMRWNIHFGEVKSSEGPALDKGKEQLAFIGCVYMQVLRMATSEPHVNIVKCLFTVHTLQGKVRQIVEQEGDVTIVDVGQLPY